MKCPIHLLGVLAFTMTGCPQPPPAEPEVSPQDVLEVTEVTETAGLADNTSEAWQDGPGDVGPEVPPWPECGPDVPGKVDPAADQHPPILHSDDFLPPQPLPCPVSTAGAEDSPFILPDGDTLYFWYTPDVSVPAEEQLMDWVTGIYVTRKTDGEWSLDGRITFKSTRSTGAKHHDEIFIMDADGGDVTQLSFVTDNQSDHDPSWATDQAAVVFNRFEGAVPWVECLTGAALQNHFDDCVPANIYVVKPGEDAVKVTDVSHSAAIPVISASGSEVLFHGGRT